jgi:hypothetical protein
MITVLNRYTGIEIASYADARALAKAAREGADLRDAVLRGAVLRGADLSDADLSGADLRNADLSGADLRNADLSDAVLRGAVLRDADLSDAVLRGAVLRGADLSDADLSDADLSDADLSGAVLRGAVLRGAVLDSAAALAFLGTYGLEADPARAAAVLKQIQEHPETWDQESWHSACSTRHCIAGWAVHQDGARGKTLEAVLGTPTAAALLLATEGLPLPSFAANATDDETLGRLEAIAARVGK